MVLPHLTLFLFTSYYRDRLSPTQRICARVHDHTFCFLISFGHEVCSQAPRLAYGKKFWATNKNRCVFCQFPARNLLPDSSEYLSNPAPSRPRLFRVHVIGVQGDWPSFSDRTEESASRAYTALRVGVSRTRKPSRGISEGTVESV